MAVAEQAVDRKEDTPFDSGLCLRAETISFCHVRPPSVRRHILASRGPSATACPRPELDWRE